MSRMATHDDILENLDEGIRALRRVGVPVLYKRPRVRRQIALRK